MSTPPNKLASFRSYSYYHVVVMCDSTRTASELAKSDDLSVWSHATPATKAQDDRPLTEDLGPYSPKMLKDVGKYVVLINGSTDASYVITDAKWMTITGANAVPGDRSTSLAVEGSLVISEPKGIAFLDQVVKCCVALGVDSSSVVYLIKTFFVGHKDDLNPTTSGQADTRNVITDIPPLMATVYDVTGSFSEQGGEYQMEFVGCANGTSRLPQYSKLANSLSITSSDSLEKTLKRLEDSINKAYDQYFNCVREQIKSTQADSDALVNSLRRVKYVIDVGTDYKDSNGIKYTVSNQPQQYKNTAGCSDQAIISFPAHTSVESAIRTVMQMSPQVMADMATGDTSTGIKYEYKVHTAVLSNPVSGSTTGELEYTVYYRVERFMVPKSVSQFEVLQQDNPEQSNDPAFERLRRNIIEFDYMYTGKNTDILEFDMKVNMGMAYLQTAVLANTFKTQLEPGSSKVVQPSTQDVNSHIVRFGTPVQTPVFFGSQIKNPNLINTQNATYTIQSAYTLNKHASLEVTDVTMRIMGNVSLLGTTNRISSPEFTVKAADKQALEDEISKYNASEADFADWSFEPAFAKVNIKMPRTNDDFLLYSGQSTTGDPATDPGSSDYAKPFWFDGYYYVLAVQHSFSSGEFTQELTMIGLPKRSAFQQSTSDAAPKEVSISDSVGKCFDNVIEVKPSTSTSTTPTVPQPPPSGNTEPTNKPDADTVSQGARDPSMVIGWDNASPEVKTAIKEAAASYGVDVVTMAQFAAIESSFKPSATASPRSSATGLYQFLQGTWNGLINAGKVMGVSQRSTQATHQGRGSNWSQPSTSDPRMNPKWNALAGAAFLRDNSRYIGSDAPGDLYLAHFMGPGAARTIIRADNRSGGHELLLTALGDEQFQRVARANPTIIKPNTTVGELRKWAAVKMAKVLKNPMAVAPTKQTTSPSTQSQTLPSPSPDTAKRTADQPVAAVQNAKVRSEKPSTTPCNPTPTTAQDKATN